MDKQTAAKALKCPYRPFVDFALSLVNLTEKEESALTLVDVKGVTEERAAEMMNVASRTVQRARKEAYQKICIVWEGNKLIEYMASMTASN